MPRQLPDITTSNCGMRCIFDYRCFCVKSIPFFCSLFFTESMPLPLPDRPARGDWPTSSRRRGTARWHSHRRSSGTNWL